MAGGQITVSLVYNWQNIETGKTGTGAFTASHHWMFGNPLWYSIQALEAEKVRQIAKWNMQQPLTWRYWL